MTRNVSGPDGDLAATTSLTGDVRLQLSNLRGDVVLTADPSLTTLDYASYDEYGVPADHADRRYGWLGGKQRSGEALADSVLMGVRLYSPNLGRFLSVDPVVGGNANAYDYCSGDGVNCTDVTGEYSTWHASCRRSYRQRVSGSWISGYNYRVRCDLGHGWVNSGNYLKAIIFAVLGAWIGFHIGGPWGAAAGALISGAGGLFGMWWYSNFCRRNDGVYITGTIYRRWTNAFGPRASWWWPGRFSAHCH